MEYEKERLFKGKDQAGSLYKVKKYLDFIIKLQNDDLKQINWLNNRNFLDERILKNNEILIKEFKFQLRGTIGNSNSSPFMNKFYFFFFPFLKIGQI